MNEKKYLLEVLKRQDHNFVCRSVEDIEKMGDSLNDFLSNSDNYEREYEHGDERGKGGWIYWTEKENSLFSCLMSEEMVKYNFYDENDRPRVDFDNKQALNDYFRKFIYYDVIDKKIKFDGFNNTSSLIVYIELLGIKKVQDGYLFAFECGGSAVEGYSGHETTLDKGKK